MGEKSERLERTWLLRAFGDFELLDANGLVIALPNRKVEALLTVLAVHRKYGIERERVAEILWPGRPPQNQRTNLRQTMMLLRRSIGESALDVSRTHCRLGSTFALQTDYDETQLRRPGGFMPGHDGDWFEAQRDCELEAMEGKGSVLTHLLETCRWYARHDPKGMFDLFRVSPTLTRGIEFRDMRDLLKTAGVDSETAGWISYWGGVSEEDLGVCARHLRTALREAKRTQNLELASEACLELGKVYVRTGHLDRAMKVCRVAQAVADDSRSQSAAINALRTQGIVLSHSGRHDVGLRLLAKSECLIRNPVQMTVALGVRALFEVSSGQFERARATQESRSKEALKVGHRGIDYVGSLTQAMLASAGGRRNAVSSLEQLSAQCHDLGSTQFGVYADELLAKLFVLEGDRGLAERRLNEARRGRRESQMAVTPLEAQLVAALH